MYLKFNIRTDNFSPCSFYNFSPCLFLNFSPCLFFMPHSPACLCLPPLSIFVPLPLASFYNFTHFLFYFFMSLPITSFYKLFVILIMALTPCIFLCPPPLATFIAPSPSLFFCLPPLTSFYNPAPCLFLCHPPLAS